MKQLIAAAAVRSYSPGLAISSWAHETNTPGAISSTIAFTRRSWSGLTKPQRKLMAIASTPSSTSSAMAVRASSSFSGRKTSPAQSTRSETSLISPGGTIGSGLRWRETCSSRSIGRPAERPNERIISRASPWPRVVIRPVRAPRICTSTLVPTVVPCSSRSVWESSSSTPRPARRAPSSTAAMKPSEKSGGVEEAFARVSVPDSSMITQSVNVPPMSTPQ